MVSNIKIGLMKTDIFKFYYDGALAIEFKCVKYSQWFFKKNTIFRSLYQKAIRRLHIHIFIVQLKYIVDFDGSVCKSCTTENNINMSIYILTGEIVQYIKNE